MRTRLREMMSTLAPARRNAITGTVNSSFSKPSAARTAMRRPLRRPCCISTPLVPRFTEGQNSNMNGSAPTRRDPRVALTAQLDALQGQPSGGVLTVDGRHRLTVKHPTKVLWPQSGLTTVDVMRYYVRVAPVLLPHVKDRPLSFRRFAQGIDGPSQFHQRIKWPTPPGVRTASFAAKAKQFETRLIGGDLTTLLYCVSLAIISQDVWLSRLEQPDRPDYAVFDLDPSPSLPFERVVTAALKLHELLQEHRVPHGVKTSGLTGLHIYVPVTNTDYRLTRMFVTQFASTVAARYAELATVTRTIQRRGRRVSLDPDHTMGAKTVPG